MSNDNRPNIRAKTLIMIQLYKPTYMHISAVPWFDYDSHTSYNLDHFPIYKRYCNSGWNYVAIDITGVEVGFNQIII